MNSKKFNSRGKPSAISCGIRFRILSGAVCHIFIIGLITLLLHSLPETVNAQCCASGNPFISDAEQPALQSEVLTASLVYRYNRSTQYYLNDTKYNDLPFSQTSFSNYTELQIGYGITKWLTVLTELGYFFNKTLETPGQQTYRGGGVGDAVLQFKFNAYHNARRKIFISPTVGVKFPVGVFDQEIDHVKLPISVQPSSGSFKYAGNVFASKGIAKKFNIALFFSYEYSQLINSDNFYYKYGDLWIGAVYCNYQVLKKLNLNLQFRNEYRGKSKREHDEIVESSGYDVVFFTPQLSYAFKHDWYVSAYADIPIYKYYNGIQMSFGYALSFRVTKKIDFIALKARHSANQSNKSE